MGHLTRVDATTVKRWLEGSAVELHEQRDYLTQLDAAIGDADHGTNMDRGFSSVVSKLAELDGSEPPGRILVTAGSKAAIHFSLMSILDPGDEVILHEPTWVSYPEQIRLCYATPVGVPYEKSIYDFEAYITPKTKAIVINNPHNPRGQVLETEELQHVLEQRSRGTWRRWVLPFGSVTLMATLLGVGMYLVIAYVWLMFPATTSVVGVN